MHSTQTRTTTTLLLIAVVLAHTGPLRADTQSFSLSAQWNLITFQVIPDNPNPQVVFSTLPGFQSAWSYDTESGLWRRYVKPAGTPTQQLNDATANGLFPLPPIEPGRAYWVYTSQVVPSWTVSGYVPTGVNFPSLQLQSGWNLIGIPVGAAAVTNTEPVSLLAILTAAGLDYDAMLTWENQTYRKMFRPQVDVNDTNAPPHPLAGLPPDPPFPTFDLQRDIGRGYWLRVLDPAVLRPRLVVTVRPDIDAEPTNNFPSKEDINVSGFTAPAAPKSVRDQDIIRFFPGEDVQTIGLSNLGDGTNGGGGILIWEAVWTPTTDIETPEPWIRLFAAPDQREQRNERGELVAAHTNLTGVTTLENDMIYLRLDRKNLGRGNHEGTLLLRTSVGDKSFQVIAEVPGLEGDFKGYAVIHSVNGKRNPVPDIDLVISLYEDNKVDGLLRGLIDSSQAVLWPVDVPLIGHRVANEGNQFIVGGSFVLPPGDQNGEPFDQWDEDDSNAGADVDWLNDDVLDVRNPFPFPIQRTVSFEGALVKANPTEGYVIEGKYREIIYGMSRQPIVLEGFYHVERQATRPLSSRRSVTADTGVEPVVTVKNPIPRPVPAGGSGDSSVSVVTEMELRSLQVSVVFNAPLTHSSLLIKLQSPSASPAELVLYDGRTSAKRINPKLLQNVTFPLDRPTEGDLGQFLRAVTWTKTEPPRFWKLIIENTGSQPVTLANWTLRLEGQPVTDVVGFVKDGSSPLAGVTVSLDGIPISMYSGLSDADGQFTLSRVPLLPVNFSGMRPGYEAENPANPGLSTMFTRPFVGQTNLDFTLREEDLIGRFNPLAGAPPALAGVPGFAAGVTNRDGSTNPPFELQLRPAITGPPRIAAGPLVAFVGATIEFYAVNPAETVNWVFGDGASDNQVFATHVYSTPGFYKAKLFSPAGGASPQDTVDVVVLSAPGHAPPRPADVAGEPNGLPPQTASANYTAYVFQPFFTMAGVVPAHKVGVDPDTGADRYLSDITPKTNFVAGKTNQFGAAYVSDMPLQHAYAATMDIDLAPRVTPPGTSQPFNSDGFTPLNTPDFDSAINVNDQGFREEDFNYALFATLWQNTRAADGTMEYIQDAQNGLIVWGRTDVIPRQNYSTITQEAKDGTDFNYSRPDDVFHPHLGTTVISDLTTTNVIVHYRMACSIGAPILTVPITPAAVKVAKLRRSQPDNPLDPELVAAPGPVSRNLYFQLHTGALGAQ